MKRTDECRMPIYVRFLLVVVSLRYYVTGLSLKSSEDGLRRSRGCDAPPPRNLPPLRQRAQTVIVVLGGPTEGAKPGPWLEWRLKAALNVYGKQQSNTTAFLLTGGRPKSYGSCGSYSEAAVMQHWLEDAGVLQGVWREDRSNHTLDNAELSWQRLAAMQQHEQLAPNATVHVITQPWHMVKASECFKVFFDESDYTMHYDTVASIRDETMVPFEQESYANMYRQQLRTWLPWQLGFNQARSVRGTQVWQSISTYVSESVTGNSHNVFFLDGIEAVKHDQFDWAQPCSAWSRINDLQWQLFEKTLTDTSDESLVTSNEFSSWGSLSSGRLPRYVTAFNPGRDSGDLLGLACPGTCGRRYDALRVAVFISRPESRASQLNALEVSRSWASTNELYSPQNVAVYDVHWGMSQFSKLSDDDVVSRIKLWNASALSKRLDTAELQSLSV